MANEHHRQDGDFLAIACNSYHMEKVIVLRVLARASAIQEPG
jgi:hypothetical protein